MRGTCIVHRFYNYFIIPCTVKYNIIIPQYCISLLFNYNFTTLHCVKWGRCFSKDRLIDCLSQCQVWATIGNDMYTTYFTVNRWEKSFLGSMQTTYRKACYRLADIFWFKFLWRLGLVYDKQALVQVMALHKSVMSNYGPVLWRIYVQSGFSLVGNEYINASLTKPIMTFQKWYHIEGHRLMVLLCNSIGSTYVCHPNLV